MTIIEIFCNAIIETHRQLVNEGIIKVSDNDLKNEKQFNELLSLDNWDIKNIFQIIIKMNLSLIEENEL